MTANLLVAKEAGSLDLTRLSVAQLAGLWRSHLTERAPDHLPRSLLAGLLAYRLQAKEHGGLSKKAVAYLKVIETDLREGRKPVTSYVESNQLKVGTQLAREHGGVLHRVTVMEGGFAWAGRTFTSLSSVARAITGTNWNGHRFFDLQGKAKAGSAVSS